MVVVQGECTEEAQGIEASQGRCPSQQEAQACCEEENQDRQKDREKNREKENRWHLRNPALSR